MYRRTNFRLPELGFRRATARQISGENGHAPEGQERVEVGADTELNGTGEEEPGRAETVSGQAQRLESLGQLAGGVAHDFNNLLAVILNYTSLVSEELAAASEFDWFLRLETAQLDLGRVTLAAERAAILTCQLLAFARQEVVRPKVLDLNRVVSGVEEMLRRTIGEQVELVALLDDDLWPILADPGQLEQVLVNLAVNARDAMPSGGILTIETENVNVDVDTIVAGSNA